MTKGLKEPPSSLQKWTPATERDLVVELERLAIHFPRTDMDARKWQILFQTFSEDFRNKSLEEIRDGCRRYRQNPENRFFPTPGQLLEACRNPFETSPGRTYAPLEDLPAALPPDIARAVIDNVRAKYNFPKDSQPSLAALKEEILARPKIPNRETPRELKLERQAALQRRLNASKTG